MKSEMDLDKKLAIGCFVGIPLFLLFLISLVFWIEGYKRGYLEYQTCFKNLHRSENRYGIQELVRKQGRNQGFC